MAQANRDPEVRKLVQEARDLSELTDDPAFQRLRRYVEGEREAFLTNLAARMMDGKVVDPVELNFHRGFYLGALMAVRRPDAAITNLEAAARVAYANHLAEETTTERKGESPYE